MKKLLILVILISSLPLFSKDHNGIKGIVIIDPGHGGVDSGNVVEANGTILEKNITIIFSIELSKLLKKAFPNYRIYITRNQDSSLKLSDRTKIAKYFKAYQMNCIFMSIHFNFHQNSSIKGIETFYFYNDNQNKIEKQRQSLSYFLAKSLQKYIMNETSKYTNDRNIKNGNLFVLRENYVPSVLLELGFLSNDYERELIFNPKYRLLIAKGIILGIKNYFQIINNQTKP